MQHSHRYIDAIDRIHDHAITDPGHAYDYADAHPNGEPQPLGIAGADGYYSDGHRAADTNTDALTKTERHTDAYAAAYRERHGNKPAR